MQSEPLIRVAIDNDPTMTSEQRERILAALKEPKSAPAPLETGNRTQIAKIFGVHPGSLKRWEKTGKLHPIKITARTLRYDMREIRAILEGATV